MSDKTTRSIVQAVYCLPTAVTVLWQAFSGHRATTATVLSASLGGFALLVLSCTLILPALVRRAAGAVRAAQWRRAAFSGIVFGAFFTFLWTAMHLPWEPWYARLFAGLAGYAATLVALWLLDRRFLHLDILQRDR
jgi:hypothetical protein